MIRYPIGIQTFSEIRWGGYACADKVRYVMALKIGGSMGDALLQIDGEGCAIPWQAHGGRHVVKVVISFSSSARTIR